MVNNLGLPGLVLVIAIFGLFIYPFWRLLPKFGYNRWISLVAFIPLGMFVLLYVLAFSEPRGETT